MARPLLVICSSAPTTHLVIYPPLPILGLTVRPRGPRSRANLFPKILGFFSGHSDETLFACSFSRRPCCQINRSAKTCTMQRIPGQEVTCCATDSEATWVSFNHRGAQCTLHTRWYPDGTGNVSSELFISHSFNHRVHNAHSSSWFIGTRT